MTDTQKPKQLTVAQLHRAWELGATHYQVLGRGICDLLKQDGGSWQAWLVERDGKDGKPDKGWEPISSDDIDDPQPVPTLEDHHTEMMGEIQEVLLEKYKMELLDSIRLIGVLRHELTRISHQKDELALADKYPTPKSQSAKELMRELCLEHLKNKPVDFGTR